MDVWKGDAPIDLTADELSAFDNVNTTPSFLGPRERFDPLSLVFYKKVLVTKAAVEQLKEMLA